MRILCRTRIHGENSFSEINLSYFDEEDKPFAVYCSNDYRGKKWWYATFVEAREDYVGAIHYCEKHHGYSVERVDDGEGEKIWENISCR